MNPTFANEQTLQMLIELHKMQCPFTQFLHVLNVEIVTKIFYMLHSIASFSRHITVLSNSVQ